MLGRHSLGCRPYGGQTTSLSGGTTLRRRGGSVSAPVVGTQRHDTLARNRATVGAQERRRRRRAKQGRRPLPFNRARRVAKTIAGICLIAASLCHLAASLVLSSVQVEEGDGTLLTAVGTHPGAWSVSQAALLASLLLLVPAILALVCLLGDRGLGYGLVGGVLALFGVLANIVTVTIGLVVGQMAQVDDHAAMEALLGRIHSAVLALFNPLAVLLLVGILMLMVGLCRRGVALGWPVVLLAIGMVISFFALPFPGFVFRVVAVAWLGFALLSLRGEKTGISSYELHRRS